MIIKYDKLCHIHSALYVGYFKIYPHSSTETFFIDIPVTWYYCYLFTCIKIIVECYFQ